jgi:hypothetical protein
MSALSETIRKIKENNGRMARFRKDLEESEALHRSLSEEFLRLQQEELGIVPVPTIHTPVHQTSTPRDQVIVRIRQLLSETPKLSVSKIVGVLNSEGFKPFKAAKFSNATVYAMMNEVKAQPAA